ncbi:helix-turn-helix domain-containing protein [Mycolicibacterium wolinskyi]|uniref:helix-turn-helix domain-containing protein n=1 Tax=Mycolicibacterium wolinskyi TaxID=59750 RepID=UPI003BA993AA
MKSPLCRLHRAGCGFFAPTHSSGDSTKGRLIIAIALYELGVFTVGEWQINIDLNQYPVVQLWIQGGAIRMTPEQTVKLINLLTEKRGALHLSVNEVARQAGVDPGTVWRIEQGMIAKPRMESLVAIARVLDINTVDLFTAVGWLTGDDLPSLGTYLRAKFGHLSDAAISDIEHYVHRTTYVYSLADSHARAASAATKLIGNRAQIPPHTQPPQKEELS